MQFSTCILLTELIEDCFVHWDFHLSEPGEDSVYCCCPVPLTLCSAYAPLTSRVWSEFPVRVCSHQARLQQLMKSSGEHCHWNHTYLLENVVCWLVIQDNSSRYGIELYFKLTWRYNLKLKVSTSINWFMSTSDCQKFVMLGKPNRI